MALGRENHGIRTRKSRLQDEKITVLVQENHDTRTKNGFFCNSVKEMSIPFYVLSAVNSAIVRIDMFQKWLQLPTGGKVAELQVL